MTRDGAEQDGRSWIRETYEEYDLQEATVAMIADPWNEDAWIRSDVTHQVGP